MRSRAVLVGVVALVLLAGSPLVAAGREAPGFVQYVEPSTAAVIDFFRPPSRFAGPGNRGWQYAAHDPDVTAAADGVVRFAGSIGGEFYITIDHDDGLRTTYSFLDDVVVAEGQAVAQGELIASAQAGLHFGVKRGSHYLDPEVLLEASKPTPRLVLAPPPGGSA